MKYTSILRFMKYTSILRFMKYKSVSLVMRCGRISGIKPILWYLISVSRHYTMLPYLTMRYAQTVGVSDLCCLEQHTEQSGSVTEIIAFKNLLVSIQVHSPDAKFLSNQPAFSSRFIDAYIY